MVDNLLGGCYTVSEVNNMIYNFSDASSIDSYFDDSTNTLTVSDDTIIDESLVRKMKDMRNLFHDPTGFDDETELYYMYNGIYRKQHESFFKSHKIKYEFTVLLPSIINGECLKAHGHIHGFNPIRQARHIEAYEILLGEGYFELFTYVGNELQVVMIQVKQGDFLIIPPDYFHLSVNTGDIPFIFGDLIKENADNDYGPLKEKNGAPLFVMKDSNNSLSFLLNDNYADYSLSIQHLTVDTLPWDNPLAKIPLYAHFITNPERFSFLK